MTSSDYNAIIDMYTEGVSVGQIKHTLGVEPKTHIVENYIEKINKDGVETCRYLTGCMAERERLGYSKGEMAEVIGVSYGNYTAFENSRLKSGERYEKITNFFKDTSLVKTKDEMQKGNLEPLTHLTDTAALELATAVVLSACSDITEFNKRIKKMNAEFKTRKYVSQAERKRLQDLVDQRDDLLEWLETSYIVPPMMDGHAMARALKGRTERISNQLVGKGSYSFKDARANIAR